MKKRMKIMKLLDRVCTSDGYVSKVRIVGSASGLDLYEGSIFYVPYGLCTDYVLAYEKREGMLVITSTCSPM